MGKQRKIWGIVKMSHAELQQSCRQGDCIPHGLNSHLTRWSPPPISSVLWELSVVSFDCTHPPSLSSKLLPQFPTIWWLEAEPLISLWHLRTLSLPVRGSLRIRFGLVRRSVPLGIGSRFQKPPTLLSALCVLPVCRSEMWASICGFSQYACCLLPWWPPVISSFSVSFFFF